MFSRCDFDNSNCGWQTYDPDTDCRWSLADLGDTSENHKSNGKHLCAFLSRLMCNCLLQLCLLQQYRFGFLYTNDIIAIAKCKQILCNYLSRDKKCKLF